MRALLSRGGDRLLPRLDSLLDSSLDPRSVLLSSRSPLAQPPCDDGRRRRRRSAACLWVRVVSPRDGRRRRRRQEWRGRRDRREEGEERRQRRRQWWWLGGEDRQEREREGERERGMEERGRREQGSRRCRSSARHLPCRSEFVSECLRHKSGSRAVRVVYPRPSPATPGAAAPLLGPRPAYLFPCVSVAASCLLPPSPASVCGGRCGARGMAAAGQSGSDSPGGKDLETVAGV